MIHTSALTPRSCRYLEAVYHVQGARLCKRFYIAPCLCATFGVCRYGSRILAHFDRYERIWDTSNTFPHCAQLLYSSGFVKLDRKSSKMQAKAFTSTRPQRMATLKVGLQFDSSLYYDTLEARDLAGLAASAWSAVRSESLGHRQSAPGKLALCLAMHIMKTAHWKTFDSLPSRARRVIPSRKCRSATPMARRLDNTLRSAAVRMSYIAYELSIQWSGL